MASPQEYDLLIIGGGQGGNCSPRGSSTEETGFSSWRVRDETVEMHPEMWRTDSSGMLSSDAADLRLLVYLPERPGEPAEFAVLYRRHGSRQEVVLAFGSEADVSAAKRAAARMAARHLGSRELRLALAARICGTRAPVAGRLPDRTQSGRQAPTLPQCS